MAMDTLSIPTNDNIMDHVLDMKYGLAKYLKITWNEIEVYQVDACNTGDCNTLYPKRRRSLQELYTQTVKYYIDIKSKHAAEKLQTDLYYVDRDLFGEDCMKNKVLSKMRLDHCDDETNTSFEQLRSATILDENNPSPSESSATALFGLSALLVAFMH